MLQGVGVALRRGNRVLVGLRRNNHGGGTWAFPGGRVEFGEQFLTTAKREVYEETLLDIRKNTIWHRNPEQSLRQLLSSPSKVEDQLRIFEAGTISINDATSKMHLFVRIVVADVPEIDETLHPVNTEPQKCGGWHWVSWDVLRTLANGNEEECKNLPPPFNQGNKLFAPLRLLARSGWSPFDAYPELPPLPHAEVEAELRRDAEEQEKRKQEKCSASAEAHENKDGQ